MQTFAFLQNLNGWEIFLIFFAILLLFGAKRLPELARGMGKSVREFRKATHEVEENFREAMHQDPIAPTKSTPPSTSEKDAAKDTPKTHA
jgi:sec-independent protein translocase protein TatA